MEYITGMQALNIPCELNTSGDWHSLNMDWANLDMQKTENSIYGDWGIEGPKSVPGTNEKYFVANTLRACLDLLERGDTALAQGMRKDYICNDEYTPLLMDKVMLLKGSPFWDKIDSLMKKEYYMKWVDYNG